MDAKKVLIALAIKCDGDWFKIYDALYCGNLPDDSEVEKICSKVKCGILTILDLNYPEHLKYCYRPPFVLFYEGDISLISTTDNHLGVVGTREPTAFYANKCKEIVSNLDPKIVVVSGVARGMDSIAHKAALDTNKKTIGVIGSGLDVVYPYENEKLYRELKRKGLLITEYPPGSSPDKEHFPMRNRLISFFSKGVFVPQAHKRSGSIITVGYALDAGKDVYCLPSEEFENSACNSLIKDGANLVENAADIMDFFY